MSEATGEHWKCHPFRQTDSAGFPDNLEALEGLMTLSKCLDTDEAEWFQNKRASHRWPSPAEIIILLGVVEGLH